MSKELMVNWLAADKKIAEVKTRMADCQKDLEWAEKEAEQVASSIKEEMVSTGEYEINLEGEFCNYKIYFTTPRRSVKVENTDAVPDEFCKIERKPKLKEIGEYLEKAETPPNWAAFQLGESKLTYKILKK